MDWLNSKDSKVYGKKKSSSVHGSGSVQGLTTSSLSASAPSTNSSSVGSCASSWSFSFSSSAQSSANGNNNEENNGVTPVLSSRKEVKTILGRKVSGISGTTSVSASNLQQVVQQPSIDEEDEDKKTSDKKSISKRKHGENTTVVPDKKATKTLRKASPPRQRAFSASVSGASLSSFTSSTSSLTRGSSTEFDIEEEEDAHKVSGLSRFRTQTHPPTQKDAVLSPSMAKSGVAADGIADVTSSSYSNNSNNVFRSNSTTSLNSRYAYFVNSSLIYTYTALLLYC